MTRAAAPVSFDRKGLLQRFVPLLPTVHQQTRLGALESIVENVVARVSDQEPSDGTLVVSLIGAADSAFGAMLSLDEARTRLTLETQRAPSEEARRTILRDYLVRTRRGKELRRDLRALDRWLDFEAIEERISVAVADRVDEIEVAYACASGVIGTITDNSERLRALGSGISLETAFRHAVDGRREAVRKAAIDCARELLRGLPQADRLRVLGVERLRDVLRWSENSTLSRWFRIAALNLGLHVAPIQTLPSLQRLLDGLPRRNPSSFPGRVAGVTAESFARSVDDDLPIIACNVLRMAGQVKDFSIADKLNLATRAAGCESEHVRQALAQMLATACGREGLAAVCAMMFEDPSPRVRAAAMRAAVDRCWCDDAQYLSLMHPIEKYVSGARDPIEVAVALEAVAVLCGRNSPLAERRRLVEALSLLIHREGIAPELAEEGAALLRRFEVESAPSQIALAERLRASLDQLAEGQEATLRMEPGTSLSEVEQALLVAARGDLDVRLRWLSAGRVAIRRGVPRRARLWRIWHEVMQPAPDKRKGFLHSHAREVGPGSHIPSHLLSEVTPTQVPGERRLAAQLGGWGLTLPRVDDLIQACRPFAKPVRIVTSLGVVSVRGPRSRMRRAAVWLRLNLLYSRYAFLRERSLAAKTAGEHQGFIEECRRLGFDVSIGKTSGTIGCVAYDTALPRFLQYLGGGAFINDIRTHGEQLLHYVVSPSGNAPWHLAVLVWLALCGFVARSAFIMGRIERARRRIPVSIGGWGTRGKSGTERLKAALFHALRCDVVVKTTGCEAMFIHARRDLPAREIFLYRPYDKATIWEQRKVLELAADLRAQVFLWECMALNPKFVEVINGDWMRDPVTTITNAYPDHEDVMGPTGEDVARVIGLFMPRGGCTFTSEIQMLPILREMARRRQCDLRAVTKLEADLLPQDLLARFPYDEHPHNIALVMRMAEHYGIDPEFALVEMADRVVPDLGVLKTYPRTRYRSRELVFSNGMSANERAGFLSNWTRLGFDCLEPVKYPMVERVVVVNNRADRIPRSRVFARILAADIGCSRIVLIGTNLDGIRRFLEEELRSTFGNVRFAGRSSADEALEIVDEFCGRLGLVSDADGIRKRLHAMVRAAVGPDAADVLFGGDEMQLAFAAHDWELVGAKLQDALADCNAETQYGSSVVDRVGADELQTHVRQELSRAAAVAELKGSIADYLERGEGAQAETLAQGFLFEMACSRIYTLQDEGAKGDAVVDFIANVVPPGLDARVLGCQNIKGTGLDFAYRFIALAELDDRLAGIDRDEARRGERLASLMTRNDYGILEAALAIDRISAWEAGGQAGWQRHLDLLSALRQQLERIGAAKQAKLSEVQRRGWLDGFISRNFEPLVDHWDSTRRTRQTGRVMTDLCAQRVSQARASALLRELVARQKGGWLARSLGIRG
ncbi:MAG: hypothetical protein OEZ06_16360 [Myxococcales bacterium]|nr:hypothetical protein [Myxococcales bacterium]